MKTLKKDWLKEVWRIKEQISKETGEMSFEEYWKYIRENAARFLAQTKIEKKKEQKLSIV